MVQKIRNKISSKFKVRTDKVVVIGTSAGGMAALIELFKQLSPDFSAPIVVVQHLSGDATGEALIKEINNNCPLICGHAVNGQPLEKGRIYLAPSDHHLMVLKSGKFLTTKGAQENRFRPAIDPLFRSAAVSFGNRVIGIVLTGYLDDGTAGLLAIQRCGGVCIVQEPDDAAYPDMPKNVLNQLTPDFCLPIAEMGGLLLNLLNAPPGKRVSVPKDIKREAEIAERVLSTVDSVNDLGEQVPFNCPGCGGVLWQMREGQVLRYRCYTGHAYTAKTLLAEQTEKIEETMWTALRMFEERRNLLITLGKEQSGASARSARERAAISQIHIDRIRSILLGDDKLNISESPE